MKMIQTKIHPFIVARNRFVARWAVLALLGMTASSQASVFIGFEADEGYPAQTFTQKTNLHLWSFAANAKISQTRFLSGSQSLELSTTAGTAIFTPSTPMEETYRSFSWSFLSTGTRVNNARTSHAYVFIGNDDTASLGAIQFRTHYGATPSVANRLYYTTWNPAGEVNTGNYVEVAGLDLAVWNTLTFTLDPAHQTYSLSLNGTPVEGVQNIALSVNWSDPDYLSQIWLNSPTNNLIAYYDNVALAIPEPGSLSLGLAAAFLGGCSLVSAKGKKRRPTGNLRG